MPAYRAKQESIPETLMSAVLGIQSNITAMDQRFQAAVEGVRSDVAEIREAQSRITATWKEKLVAQIGAIALAALTIIGAQRALAPTPPPERTVVQQSELSVRADGCAKMANNNDDLYAQCMVREVVMPNTPSAREVKETH